MKVTQSLMLGVSALPLIWALPAAAPEAEPKAAAQHVGYEGYGGTVSNYGNYPPDGYISYAQEAKREDEGYDYDTYGCIGCAKGESRADAVKREAKAIAEAVAEAEAVAKGPSEMYAGGPYSGNYNFYKCSDTPIGCKRAAEKRAAAARRAAAAQ